MSLPDLPEDHSQSPLPPGSRAEQEEDIQEMILLHIMKTPNHFLPPVVFVSINGEDPSTQFLQRFTPHQLQAKPDSESAWGRSKSSKSGDIEDPFDDFFEGVIDPSTGQDSASYDAGLVEWLSPLTVKLSGSCTWGSLAAYGNEYELRWNGQTWEITKETEGWIS